jgi:transposase-like protein
VNFTDRKAVAAASKLIYTATDADGALIEFEAFEMAGLGKHYPLTVKAFREAWEVSRRSSPSRPRSERSSKRRTRSSR